MKKHNSYANVQDIYRSDHQTIISLLGLRYNITNYANFPLH